jgi:hypothetical protein
MGLFCSKLKTCKNDNHHIRGITCCKCNKDYDYCMDCDFPEWYNCCTDGPLLYRNMNFPKDRNVSLENYVWNKKGYFEVKEDIIQKNRLRYEKLENDRKVSQLKMEEQTSKYNEARKRAKCTKCGFPIKELMEKYCEKKYFETSIDQTCTDCFLQEHKRKTAHLCRRCCRTNDSYSDICYECSVTCRKCNKNINTPQYETISVRDEYCQACKHNHTSKCNSTHERVVRGTNVFFDTQIGPGRYYNNMVHREEPFSYSEKILCGCSIPTTTTRVICIHET